MNSVESHEPVPLWLDYSALQAGHFVGVCNVNSHIFVVFKHFEKRLELVIGINSVNFETSFVVKA